MKNRTIALLVLLVALSVSTKTYSQNDEPDYNPIQTVVPWLTIAPDSRAGAMGDAGVATSPDIYSQHWNPAKFAFIDGKGGVGISYIPWLRNLVPDINIAYLSGYYRFDTKQVMSGSLMYSSYGKIEFTDDGGATQLIVNPNEWAVDLGYSRLFSDNFSGGVAFRFIYSNLTHGYPAQGEDTRPGLSIAADISGYYHKDLTLLDKNSLFAFGFNISNIGSKMSYTESYADFIPMNLKLGSSLSLDFDRFNRITFTIDLNKLLVPSPDSTITEEQNISVPEALFKSFADAPDGFMEELREITYSYGAEYWYNNIFALRAGYFHENTYKGNRQFFTAGAGFRMSGFTIDFSYLMPVALNHPLARTLRFSLSFDSSALRNASKR
ncbi:MAG: type IX secretion system outer membrane channel protein PorV [Bacteroidales bacterium]|nr:type IX secretion system outer membrane channel protein PorV [Bacteroidales bacterium]